MRRARRRRRSELRMVAERRLIDNNARSESREIVHGSDSSLADLKQ